MVFQGSLLPALGIMLTPWEPRPEVLPGVGLTLFASSYLYLMLRRGHLRPWHLALNGLCYVAYLVTLTW
jgi:cation:H+ antiporter